MYALNSSPTNLQVGNSIKITYSATDIITGTITLITNNGQFTSLTITVTNIQIQSSGYSRTNTLYYNAPLSYNDTNGFKDSASRKIPANSFVWDLTLNYDQPYSMWGNGSDVYAILSGVEGEPSANTTNIVTQNMFTYSTLISSQVGFKTGTSLFFPSAKWFQVNYIDTRGGGVYYATGDGAYSYPVEGGGTVSGGTSNPYAGLIRGYTLSYGFGTITLT